MEVIALNSIDPKAIPKSVCVRLCRGAIEMSMRHMNDPGREERYQKWLSEQKAGKDTKHERTVDQRQHLADGSRRDH